MRILIRLVFTIILTLSLYNDLWFGWDVMVLTIWFGILILDLIHGSRKSADLGYQEIGINSEKQRSKLQERVNDGDTTTTTETDQESAIDDEIAAQISEDNLYTPQEDELATSKDLDKLIEESLKK